MQHIYKIFPNLMAHFTGLVRYEILLRIKYCLGHSATYSFTGIVLLVMWGFSVYITFKQATVQCSKYKEKASQAGFRTLSIFFKPQLNKMTQIHPDMESEIHLNDLWFQNDYFVKEYAGRKQGSTSLSLLLAHIVLHR